MNSEIEKLIQTMRALRHPTTGCPWDLKQTHQTLAPYCIEEAFEAVEAIESGKIQHMMEELGDVLLQVVFHGQLLEEQKKGSFDVIAKMINDKMVERHPHVFNRVDGDRKLSAEEVLDTWNQRKLEKASPQSQTPVADKLNKLSLALPALHRAMRHGEVLQSIGFDWSDGAHVWEKVEEEKKELKEAMDKDDRDNMEEELGDLLYVMTQWARKMDLDPEAALRRSIRKGSKRIEVMEKLAVSLHRKQLKELPIQIQEQLWTEAKKALKSK